MNDDPKSGVIRIRAAVLDRKGGPLRLETLEMDGPRADEILVRLVASGICRTDVDYCDEWYGGTETLVLGHEGAGVVEQAGDSMTGFAPGDHVVLSYQSCGECPACRERRPARCAHFWALNFGFARRDGSNALRRSGAEGHFFGQSSFASHALATGRNLVRVGKDLPLERLAPLGCGLQTGAGTVLNVLQPRPGQSVAVFGSGAVGLAAVMAARLAGAKPILAVDVLPERLALARELGATHTVDNRSGEVAGRLAEVTGGGVDFVVETTGNLRLHRMLVEVLNPGGTAALLTGESGTAELPGGRRTLGVIQGDAVPQRFIPELIDHYRAGRFPFDRLLSFYDFAEINRAMDDLRRGITIKPVLRMTTDLTF